MANAITAEEKQELARLAPIAKALARGKTDAQVEGELKAAGWTEREAREVVERVRKEYFQKTKRFNRAQGIRKMLIGGPVLVLAVALTILALVFTGGRLIFFAVGLFVFGAGNFFWGLALFLDP